MTMTPVAIANASTAALSVEAPAIPLAADPEAALAMLEVTEGAEAEQANRSDRTAAELLEQQQDDAAVAAMHDKASLMEKQAWADFGVNVLSACVQASDASDCGSAGGAPSSSSSGQDAALLKACQSLGDGVITAKEANDDADVKAYQTGATAAGFTVQSDTEAISDASDLVKAALGAFQQYVTTEAQTQAAALHRA
jgi:hypothetical protein